MDNVAALEIEHRNSPVSRRVTVSLGASTVSVSGSRDIDTALRRADEALYLAKSCGRNCARFLHGAPAEQPSGPNGADILP